jgi:DNA-directed RNA polymerase subunit beta
VIVKKGRKITKLALKRMDEFKIKRIPVSEDHLVGKVLSRNVVDAGTGEILVRCNQ